MVSAERPHNFAPLPSLARAPRLIEVTRYTMDTEERPADEEDHAMEQAEASEPADTSSAPGTDEDRKHQAEQHERLFGSASTAEDAPAAADEPDDPDDPDEAPVVLNDAQKERLIAAIDEMRRSTRNVNTRCLGWRLEYNLRKNGGTTRGDMMAIDPADGQKLFSVVSVKRKLGMLAPAAAREPSSDGGGEAAAPRRLDPSHDWGQVLIEGSRRSRSVVNYAEAAGGGAGGLKTGDMILSTVKPKPEPKPKPDPNPNPDPNSNPNPNQVVEHDPSASRGVSLLDLAEGVYQRGAHEGEALPFVVSSPNPIPNPIPIPIPIPIPSPNPDPSPNPSPNPNPNPNPSPDPET